MTPARCSKTKTQLCSLLQFLTTDKRWYPPVPDWKDLLLPASRGDRPVIDGGRTPVAYSILFFFFLAPTKPAALTIALDKEKLSTFTKFSVTSIQLLIECIFSSTPIRVVE